LDLNDLGFVFPSAVVEREVGPHCTECRKHAGAVGISSTEMKEGFDDLEMAMAKAIEKLADQKPERLVEKDG
jgi:hypothetical protein